MNYAPIDCADARETLAVAKPDGVSVRRWFRQAARDICLSALAVTTPSRGDRFLRCFNSHFVFDEQRDCFSAKISKLKKMGDFVCTSDAVQMACGDTPIDGRYFHLSFDDGLACLLRNAAPILHEQDVAALVFVNSAIAGDATGETRSEWYRAVGLADRIAVLDWEGLRALRSAGFEIGAHTRHHRRLSAISGDTDQLVDEIAGCKAEIEEALDQPCDWFAWPFGSLSDVDERSIAAIRDAGYRAAFGAYRGTIRPGETDRFAIPRHHIEPNWPWRHVAFFARGGLEKEVGQVCFMNSYASKK